MPLTRIKSKGPVEGTISRLGSSRAAINREVMNVSREVNTLEVCRGGMQYRAYIK